MAKTGSIGKFNKLFLQEKSLSSEVERTPPAVERRDTRGAILTLVQETRKSADLDTIIAVERRFLENDRSQYVNSPAMHSSLDQALAELSSAERHIEIVDDKASYAIIDKTHSLPKNRKSGVPFDEARQFFSSHAARLLNQDKSRLDDEEKAILDERKQNMRAAAKLYEARQRKTLGIAPKRTASASLGM